MKEVASGRGGPDTMDIAGKDTDTRRVHMGTLHGMVEGDLRVSPTLRTLDFLNRSSAKFIRIQEARVTSAHWHPGASATYINASFVLWVAEVTALRARGRRAAPLQSRSGIRMCLPDCEILGFLHTSAHGDPVVRLNQDASPFFALTSASVIGPDVEFAAAFLAVNRAHVFAAEALADTQDDIGTSDDLLAASDLALHGEPR